LEGIVVNKYILVDMIAPMLKKEMDLVDYPLPEELKVREGEHPAFGKFFERASRYKAAKTKRVAFNPHFPYQTGLIGIFLW